MGIISLQIIFKIRNILKYFELRSYLYLIIKNNWNLDNIKLNFYYKYLDGAIFIRIKNIENENGQNGLLNGVAMVNSISRNIKVDKIIIEKNLNKSLNIEPINLRWVISSFDSVVDCEEFDISDRALAQAVSIFLSQLKLYLDYTPDLKKDLLFGLTTFRKGGDIFYNQKNRIKSLAENNENIVSKCILKLLLKLDKLNIKGFSEV
jgi:hypothetical protein